MGRQAGGSDGRTHEEALTVDGRPRASLQAASRACLAGQGLVEYGMLLVLIAVACAAALGMFGTSVLNLLSSASVAF